MQPEEDPSSSDSASLSGDESSDIKSSSNGSSSGFDSTSNGKQDDGSQIMNKIISKEEQKALQRVRIAVLLVFLCCAVAVSVAVYFFATASDQATFEIDYKGYANDIITLAQWETQNNFALVAKSAAHIINVAAMSNATFPYLTDYGYEVVLGYVNGMSGVDSLQWAPFVNKSGLAAWEEYSVKNQDWIAVGKHLQKVHPQHLRPLQGTFQDESTRRALQEESVIPNITDFVYTTNENLEKIPVQAVEDDHIFAPVWQVSPTPYEDPSLVNFDVLSDPYIQQLYKSMIKMRETVVSPVFPIDYLIDSAFGAEEEDAKGDPHGFIVSGVYESFEPDAPMVGLIVGIQDWRDILNNVLPKGENGYMTVIKDTCGQSFSFEINGQDPNFLGYGDMHDPAFDSYVRSARLERYLRQPESLCEHELFVYPSVTLQASYTSSKPVVYTVIVAMSFLLTFAMFVVYDVLVSRRQKKTMANALRTNAIVASLFPENVRDRLMEEAAAQVDRNARAKKNPDGLKSFLNENEIDSKINADDDDFFETKPIADLFPHTTVMFADIAGFTAWSSAREPAQVFTLLESVYRAFDKIAKQRKVYKVETVGDCYVAVCGLPDPRKDHAIIMARFARDCLFKMNEMTKKLESMLGPDTGDLALRIGLHSGPVTAGVLRGDNARFQLFGDTMNTAARVESSGKPNRIHCSEETAELLKQSGKGHWAQLREDKVVAKGKGELTTYWLQLKGDNAKSSHSAGTSESGASAADVAEVRQVAASILQPATDQAKEKRLVDWNIDLLSRLLKQIIARRQAMKTKVEDDDALRKMEEKHDEAAGQPIDEVEEDFIELPKFRETSEAVLQNIELPKEVEQQLNEFVSVIASMYPANPFHNFEHASHVTMSVTKLLSRIVAPSEHDIKNSIKDESQLHDHTYGITSDPLTQFSCVLSALIHDLDHPGVPNMTLIKENTAMASYYKGKSVAEQNSIDLAWSLLMDDTYKELRHTIYANSREFKRFRQLLVNSVMATDIMDKDLKSLRNNRWEKAFSESAKDGEPTSSQEDTNRKATIVIEHLIQASDVSHTMQHWHIYRKWNERFFQECYKAFKEGRSDNDPSLNWYKGEIGFFDFYIIPLAKKLKDCGVFGVSSDEYLSYAIKNRNEWERRGTEIVEEMMEKMG